MPASCTARPRLTTATTRDVAAPPPDGGFDWSPVCLGSGVRRMSRRTQRSEKAMAYGIVHFFPGGTKEQYEASIAAVHPGPDKLPDGQVFHAAGPSAGGWTIMAVHESQESWERFRDEILMPRMQAGIEGGFASPPDETAIDLYKVVV